jgi:putative ABC transport system ATP-binding protein
MIFIIQYLDARQTHFRIVMRQVIGFLSLQAVANASLLILGVWLITKNQLSIGQLVAAEIVVSTVFIFIG